MTEMDELNRIEFHVQCTQCGNEYDTSEKKPDAAAGRPLDFVLTQMRCGLCGSARILVNVPVWKLF